MKIIGFALMPETRFSQGVRLVRQARTTLPGREAVFQAPTPPVVQSGAIYPAGTRGDSLRLWLSGAESKSLAAVGSIPDVAVLAAAGRCGSGRGVLRSSGDGTLLSWKAPGSDTFGSTVDVSTDGAYLLEDGEDADKWLRVYAYNNYIATGGRSQYVYLEDRYNNAAGHDDITAAEASSGNTEIYQVTMQNDNPMDLLAVRLWLETGTSWRLSVAKDTDTVWSGQQADKLYLSSGFSNTISNSISVGVVDTYPSGVAAMDDDALWSGHEAAKLYRQSGFSSTLSTSVDVSSIDTSPRGADWDNDNAIWPGVTDCKLYRQSGFSSTLSTSVDVSGVDLAPIGIAWDNTHALWSGGMADKIYTQSGFSSTFSTSISVTAIDTNPSGVGWDGANITWCGTQAGKLYRQKGRSSTLDTSVSVGAVDTSPDGTGWWVSSWKTPTSEYHGEVLSWDRLVSGEYVTFFVKRVTSASASSDPDILNAFELAFDAY